MEKRIVTLLMLMVCTIGAMAQQLSVQCQVNDSKGEGVPFATIYIYNIGDTTKVVSSGVSDAFGKVNHHLANPGSYLMRVHFWEWRLKNVPLKWAPRHLWHNLAS